MFRGRAFRVGERGGILLRQFHCVLLCFLFVQELVLVGVVLRGLSSLAPVDARAGAVDLELPVDLREVLLVVVGMLADVVWSK